MMTVSITISLLLVSVLNSSKHEVSRDETASQNKVLFVCKVLVFNFN